MAETRLLPWIITNALSDICFQDKEILLMEQDNKKQTFSDLYKSIIINPTEKFILPLKVIQSNYYFRK